MSLKSEEYGQRARETLGFSRWWLVFAAAIMMGLVSPYQYVWSSIEGPLATSLGIPLPALGMVFTLFVVFQAGSQFPVGWWRDRHGPRNLTILAGILAGGGYVGLAYATEVWQLYVLYSLGAIGVGIIYTVAVNTALKWFPDRRGLTTGIGTMAFAGGSVLFVPYVRQFATPAGYSDVLRNMGLLIGFGIIILAFFLRDPPSDLILEESETPSDEPSSAPDVESSDGDQYMWRDVAKTWQFWLMYVMFIAVSGAGLMLTAKVVSFAQNMDLTATITTISATVLPLSGGIGRLVIGDLSDRVSRRYAMTLSFVMLGVGLIFAVWFASLGWGLGFVGAVIVSTFFWSSQYTLFPSIVGDFYGREHSSANYALLYSGKMWGGIFGGTVASILIISTSWSTTFVLSGVLSIVAGLLALTLTSPR